MSKYHYVDSRPHDRRATRSQASCARGAPRLMKVVRSSTTRLHPRVAAQRPEAARPRRSEPSSVVSHTSHFDRLRSTRLRSRRKGWPRRLRRSSIRSGFRLLVAPVASSLAETGRWRRPAHVGWTGTKLSTAGRRADHRDCRRSDAVAGPFLLARCGFSARLAAIMAAISVTSQEKYIQSRKRGNAANEP
jgi:hypothetical protein